MKFSKDVLRVGTWSVGGKMWNVTRDMLHRLVSNFNVAKQRGVRIPIQWDHSDSARDRVGDVTGLALAGDTLLAEVDVTDEHASRKLSTQGGEVSVQVVQPWIDGAGNVYDLFMAHLAVVNLPVVAGQGDFRRLATSNPSSTVFEFATAQCGGTGAVKVSNSKGPVMMTEVEIAAAQQRIRQKLGISRPTTRQLATRVPADDAATLDHAEVIDYVNRLFTLLIGDDFEPIPTSASPDEIKTVFRIMIGPFEKNAEREAARARPAAPDAMAGINTVQQLSIGGDDLRQDIAAAKIERRLTRKWRLGS